MSATASISNVMWFSHSFVVVVVAAAVYIASSSTALLRDVLIDLCESRLVICCLTSASTQCTSISIRMKNKLLFTVYFVIHWIYGGGWCILFIDHFSLCIICCAKTVFYSGTLYSGCVQYTQTRTHTRARVEYTVGAKNIARWIENLRMSHMSGHVISVKYHRVEHNVDTSHQRFVWNPFWCSSTSTQIKF